MRYSVSTADFERGVFDPQIGCWWMRKDIVAFRGLCQVRAPADPYFGGEESQSYRSKVLFNPTWKQLFMIAKKQQQATRDMHHDFFEGYHDTKRDDMLEHRHPVRILNLVLGS